MNKEEQLKDRYEELYRTAKPGDDWIEVEPAIPFVGDHYGSGGYPKVLVYGSAENLNYPFKHEEMTFCRNRKVFKDWKGRKDRKDENFEGSILSVDNWFPWVHMTPVSNGTLLTAARYLLDYFENSGFSELPGEFILQIAIGNYGKFSRRGKTNSDYASRPEPLAVADPYVIADMSILEPDVVIIPRSIYSNAFKRVLEQASHKPKIWPIYQTNNRVINQHINPQLNDAGLKEEKSRGGHWSERWLQHISHKIRMGRYLDWLDWRCGKLPELKKPNWYIRH